MGCRLLHTSFYKFVPTTRPRATASAALHFHLSVAHEAGVANPRTPSGLSYEDSEFAYEPILDEKRDRDLLAILPDYLAEDICFPRCDAVKFYTKVVESMTKKIVVDEEDP